MSFESALREELFTITELVGNVHPLNASEDAEAPYLVYVSSEGLPDRTLEGFASSKEVSCELNVIHSTYGSLKTLTGAILSLIQSFQGRSIGASGPFIQSISYEEPVELYEPEIKKYRCNIEITVKI